MELRLRTIQPTETALLEPLYLELAQHHNEVSTHFAGGFPTVPVTEQIRECAEDLSAGKSEVAVIELQGEVVALCKVDVVDERGYVDELAVMSGHRGEGLGSRLMDWAEDVFHRRGVRQAALLVVVGNEGARRFYERRGFSPALLEMRRDL